MMTDEIKTDPVAQTSVPERDSRLSALLREWDDPQVPQGLDARVLDAYRSDFARIPAWKRWLTFRIAVPLPVAVATLLLLLLSASFLIRQGFDREGDVPQVAGSGSETQTARGPEAPVVTQTSLAGFEPVDDVNVLVVQEAQATR